MQSALNNNSHLQHMICSRKLNSFANTNSVEELWRLHTKAMETYGFDRLIYGYTRYRTSESLGDPEDFVLLTNHDEAYTNTFIGKAYYLHAPMMRWVLNHDGPISWSVLKESLETGTLTEKEKQVLEFNKIHGVTAGYSISFNSLYARNKGAVSLVAKRGLSQEDVDFIWDEHGEDITLINNLTHLKLLSLPYHPPRRTLTDRQKEVLRWVSDGKTMQDIAVLMNVTPVTIEKHLKLAREVLNVETTAQAVLKAAFLNQIFIFGNESL